MFDARMGNVDLSRDSRRGCQTCNSGGNNNTNDGSAATNPRCLGHFGHIELPTLVYHPLLTKDTLRLLRSMCWTCGRCRLPEATARIVRKAVLAADKGDRVVAESNLEMFLVMNTASSSARAKCDEMLSNLEEEDDILGTEGDNNNNNPGDNVPLMQRFSKRATAAVAVDEEEAALLRDPPTSCEDMLLRIKILKAFFTKASKPTCGHCGASQPKDLRIQDGLIYFNFADSAKNLEEGMRVRLIEEKAFFNRSICVLKPEEAMERLRRGFAADMDLYGAVLGPLGQAAVYPPCAERGVGVVPTSEMHKYFFLSSVLVPPNNLRRYRMLHDRNVAVVDQTTEALSSVLHHAASYRGTMRDGGDEPGQQGDQVRINRERFLKQLHLSTSKLFNLKVGSFQKKQGLFRNNMMGKRVNQAARSVISPDGHVELNELCIPRRFATRLSFPDSLSLAAEPHRKKLMRCIENGTNVYPGASHIEVTYTDGRTEITALKGKEGSLTKIALRMQALCGLGHRVTVHRHLWDGDAVLFNRQPTLHKNSLIGKRVVVRGNEYTMRFHYASCKGFNADFDGD
eukprot:PhM_4_TR2062/c1_g1_i1/m.99974/K02999/RPA1, POLR1A; DNA-directed RNA polymerase I subunit RPA1